MTSYDEIYNLCLRLIDDPIFAQWPEEDMFNELHNWMLQAIYKLPKLRKVLSDRDEENLRFNTELTDVVKMVLALGMKREWLQPQLNSITLTLQRSSKKEAYSQAEHLKALQGLNDSINIEIKKLLRDDTYVDSDYLA